MRVEQITFTRFLAAISIVIFHYGQGIFPFDNPLLSYLFQQANIGVSYFFILSGFVMIIAYNNKPAIDSFDYYKNRFARIYPVYLLAIVFLFTSKILAHEAIDYTGMTLNLLVVQAWIPGQALSFNGPGWSLSVELLFYAVFPILFNSVYKKTKPIRYIVPIVVLFIISQVALHWFIASGHYDGFGSKSHEFIFYFPLMHWNEFLIGNLAGLYFVRQKTANRNYDLPVLAMVVLMLLALRFANGLNFHNGLFAVLFVPFIILMALNNGWISKILNAKPLVFLGEISFGIYILQAPVFKFAKAVYRHLGLENKLVLFYLLTATLIVVSGLSYHFIETPLRNKIKRFNWKKVPS